MANNSKSKSSKKNKSKKKSSKKGSQSQRTTQFGSSEGFTWFSPGKTMAQFWADDRLKQKKVSATFDGSMVNPKIDFEFYTANERGTALVKRNFNATEYLAWRAKLQEQHSARQEEESWNVLTKKLASRLQFSLEEIERPKIFTSKAKAAILDILTPFERAVLNLSQSNWNKVDPAKVDAEYPKFGKNNQTLRIAYLKQYFSDAKAVKPSLVLKEHVAYSAKEVLSLLERKDVPKDA